MSSPSAYQCLFCNHLNPAGASFCNECGSQLQLQQCDLCGSINKRSARVCYKCGAAFDFASPVGAGAAALEHRAPATAFEHAPTTLPESLIEALGARRGDADEVGVRGGLRKSYADSAPEVDVAETVDDHPAVASSAGSGRPLAGALPVASRFNYRQTLALVALVSLFAIATIVFMRASSGPASPSVPAGGEATALRVQPPSAPVAADAVTRSATHLPTGGSGAAGVVPPPSTSSAGSPGSEETDPSTAHREAAARACQPAVAALGLCEAVPAQEKK